MDPVEIYARFLHMLCCWREARGEITAAKTGQAWSVKNRVLNPSWWGTGYIEVILKPYQYSSFNHSDPNSTRFPSAIDSSWIDCQNVCEEVYDGTTPDPTGGATNYFDKSMDAQPPGWATDGSMTHTCDIGSFHFYKRSGT
jgi:hypothetical protein